MELEIQPTDSTALINIRIHMDKYILQINEKKKIN